VSGAAAHEGARLRNGLLDKSNLSAAGWADSAYRSKANERYLGKNGFTSRIHRKKPKGRPMPERTARANARKSSVRARVEHVFAHQKDRMELFIHTVGLARGREGLPSTPIGGRDGQSDPQHEAPDLAQ